MIQNINDLYGYKLAAIDGEIGQIKDFYFDDHDWVIRYLVVETGSWISGRQVLLTPHTFGPSCENIPSRAADGTVLRRRSVMVPIVARAKACLRVLRFASPLGGQAGQGR